MDVRIVLVVAAVLAVVYIIRRRGRVRTSPYRRAWLLVYSRDVNDGPVTFRAYPVTETVDGVQASDKIIYPQAVLTALEGNSSASILQAELGGRPLYFFAVQSPALAEHRTLERARQSIAIRAIFFGGGDILHYLTVAALIVPLIVSVLMYGQVSGLQSTLARVEAGIGRLVTPDK